MLSTILKKSKSNYYIHCFRSHWNNIKNVWTVFKSFLSIENIPVDNPKSAYIDGTTISNPMAISNVFNNDFSSIANKTNLIISCLDKHFLIFFKIDLMSPFLRIHWRLIFANVLSCSSSLSRLFYLFKFTPVFIYLMFLMDVL